MLSGPLICIVDDDESIRESLPALLGTFGFAVAAFASGEGFFRSGLVSIAACLVLDLRMPDMSGPMIQARLANMTRRIPIVYMTAHVEESLRRQLLDQGAVDLLPKPFSEKMLMNAIHRSLRSA
jgi:FixJ family two-component response regulator